MQTLSQLAERLRTGDLSLFAYLDDLETKFNELEPSVQAFVPENGRFDRLRRDAQALLEKYPYSPERPLLFGIPVGVKDIFHVEGFPTHAGSQLPIEVITGEPSVAVQMWQDNGALIFGKAHTTEFAYFAPAPTTNPANPAHTPGGSSSGSAAAVAAGLVPLAFGTQTIGSINRPAAFCGTIGYKPSHERISRQGVIPLSPSVDHIGFFAPDVLGVSLAASCLCLNWQPTVSDAKPVLGIPEGPYLERTSPEGLTHFRAVAKKLSEAGFIVKSVPAMADFEEIYVRHNLIVAADAAQVHERWFADYGDLYHPKTADLIRKGQAAFTADYVNALAGRVQLRHELEQLMDQNGIDLWLSPPALGAAPHGLDSTGDPIMNLPWTHAGLPSLTLPAGTNEAGLPMGIQLAGRFYGDEQLFHQAAHIEAAL